MKPFNQFILFTFLFFIIGFGIAGLLMAVNAPNFLFVLVQILMAWTPTASFAIIHKKVDPGRSIWRYIADRFAAPIKLLPLLASILIPVFATAVVWVGYSLYSGKPLVDLIPELSLASILLIFVDNLIRGPLGEELGWRGYMQMELNKRFPLLKSSLIIGAVWGMWHFPLWFVTGLEGTDLILYIIYFLAGIISSSVIIGFIYSRGGNLLYAILLHQMLNFTGKLLAVDDLTILGGSTAVYVIIALVIGLTSLRSMRVEVAAQ